MIFERLDQWIWSLRHDKPPNMTEVEPKLALESLARICGPSQASLPTIEFPRRVSSISPVAGLVVGTALALQNARFPVSLSGNAPVDVGQGIGKVCMLIHIGVISDGVPGPLGIKMGRNPKTSCCHSRRTWPGRSPFAGATMIWQRR